MVEKLKNAGMVDRAQNLRRRMPPRLARAIWLASRKWTFALGELLGYLQRTGKDSNTIMVYGTDHGAYEGTFGVPEKAPGICSEAVCRVPMLWYVPGRDGKRFGFAAIRGKHRHHAHAAQSVQPAAT